MPRSRKTHYSISELDSELLRVCGDYSGLPQQNDVEAGLAEARKQYINSKQHQTFLGILQEAGDSYYSKIKDDLWPENELDLFTSKIEVKAYKSIVDKIYRKNFVRKGGGQTEKPPRVFDAHSKTKNVWIKGDNFEAYLNDLVRGRLIVKTVDGIPFLHQHFSQSPDAQNFGFRSTLQNNNDGYYALHMYIPFKFVRSENNIIDMNVEFQVHTQLRSFLSTLTHENYEAIRQSGIADASKYFKWGNGDQFLSSSLGHMLQFIEVAMVRIRDGRTE